MRKKILYASMILFLFAIAGIVLKWDRLFPSREWAVTQYGPRAINSSFYTIYQQEKGLIVIDGGWEEDSEYVREVIRSHGNRVDAWILTHPHPDHIGAFTALYKDLRDIQVDAVYTVDMASPKACKKRAKWDTVEAYKNFLKLDIPELSYVYEGDELSICGLEFKIFSAYGDPVKERSKDYLNDGSMMFQVKAPKQTMLFCADVGASVSDYLLDKWGTNLASDYLQMGHHGYGGLKESFYEMVKPKAAFFDAPDWLMFDNTGTYDNPENAAFMEGLGSQIFSFRTAPNQIFLE